MYMKSLFIIILSSLIMFNSNCGIRWLGIYRLPKSADHPVDTTAERFTHAECQKAAGELGLRKRQMRFCTHPRFGYAMLAVLRAAHAVGYHCPKTFSDRRWNCTSIHQMPHVSPELRRGTREQALVHAFSSAVLLFEIGRYCALNKIRYCSCGDDSAAYTSSVNLMEPNAMNNYDAALIYNTQNNPSNNLNSMKNMLSDPVESSNQNVPMIDGQPTVNKFYWAGCSDNLRIAKEYTSLFLGFPNVQVPLPPPVEVDDNTKSGMNNPTMQNRYKRSTAKHFPLKQVNNLRQQKLMNGFIDTDENDKWPDGSAVDDGDEDDDEDWYSIFPEYTDRKRRNLNFPWQYGFINSENNNDNHNNKMVELKDYHSTQLYSTEQNVINRNLGEQFYPDQIWNRKPRSRQGNTKASLSKIMNRHNYLAGVVLMESNQKLVCKCHGVSGSCAQRVCFRQLRRIDTEVMQKALKMKYLAAKQITQGRNNELYAKTFIDNGFVDEIVKPEELVFSEHSPDYCNVEPNRGSVGTRNRLCTLNDTGTASCVNMCCGRGHRDVTKHEIVQCNCRMGSGFTVECEECNIETVTHRCL